MKPIRMIASIVAATGALALGAAYAQDAAKKPEAKPERGHQHRGMQGMGEKHQRVGEMHKADGKRMQDCPMGEPRDARTPQEHDHS